MINDGKAWISNLDFGLEINDITPAVCACVCRVVDPTYKKNRAYSNLKKLQSALFCPTKKIKSCKFFFEIIHVKFVMNC